MDHFSKVMYYAWHVVQITNNCVDRVVVSEHLPLAHTRSTDAEELQLMDALEDLKRTFKGH